MEIPAMAALESLGIMHTPSTFGIAPLLLQAVQNDSFVAHSAQLLLHALQVLRLSRNVREAHILQMPESLASQ
eukprot:XP_001709535.1 Hypothetical protein GL50803_6501 [Giardia lamblia ATCC 50803]